MAWAVNFPGKEAIYTAFEQERNQRPDIAIAVGVPDVYAVGGEFFVDAFVSRNDYIFKKVQRNIKM